MPEVGAAAKRSYPTSKEQWLRGHRRAERSYSTFDLSLAGPAREGSFPLKMTQTVSGGPCLGGELRPVF